MLHISCRARSACRGLSTWALSPRLPFTAQPLQGVRLFHHTAGPLQCLKPGQAPEDVVKRISKGVCMHVAQSFRDAPESLAAAA